MTFTIDRDSYNKAAVYIPGHGYSIRASKLSGYRSIIDHTTNGKRGTTFHAEAMYIFRSPDISSHYLIGKEGEIAEFLNPRKFIAWHAGSVRAMKYSNPYAIGIEMHNTPTEGHCTDLQLEALDWLVRKLLAEYSIPFYEVETHRYVAIPAGRKIDPSGFPDSEFYAWRNTLKPYTTFKVNNPRGVNVRQAPNIDAIIAGTLAYNEVFESDVLKEDEHGQYINGTNLWAHMVTGLGFVHTSNLVRV